MKITKKMLVTAICASFGFSVMVEAASVTKIHFEDMNDDGLSSDFKFFSAPGGSDINQWAAGAGDGAVISTGVQVEPGILSNGFDFVPPNGSFFAPFVKDTGGTGSIDAEIDFGGTGLTFSSLDFGGNYPFPGGSNFFLAPDTLAPGTGGCSSTPFTGIPCPEGYLVETLTDFSDGNYGFVVRYTATIPLSDPSFGGYIAHWRLEGCMSTDGDDPTCGAPSAIPVPAAVWLFGSGLIGLVGVARRKAKTTA